MPLALTFLATQFRMALVAREAGLRGAGQIQAHFNKIGARMWPERARQIEQTVSAFPKSRLERALVEVIRGGPVPARCAAGRPHRDGGNDSGADYALKLSGSELAQAQRDAALIPRRRVLLDDAPLGGAVDQGERLRHDRRGVFRVLGFEQPAKRTNLVAQP